MSAISYCRFECVNWGSKPPVTRVRSDQAKEFLSQPVMEWLKEKRIRQTFTSGYDSQANGVAERWINLIMTKSTALLASKYMPTPFWCYAVAWVARCYNIKVLGQKPRKNLPEFGQLLIRMAGSSKEIPKIQIKLCMLTTKEKLRGWHLFHIFQHPHFAALQRAVDGHGILQMWDIVTSF